MKINYLWQTVGSRVGEAVTIYSESKMKTLKQSDLNRVRYQMWAQVVDQVYSQVYSQVWFQVRNQVLNQVYFQVNNQVRTQINENITSNTI